jgi:hypothetical protein
MNDDIYTIQELIDVLEKIKQDGDGSINFCKAFYVLALEIKALKEKENERETLHLRRWLRNKTHD